MDIFERWHNSKSSEQFVDNRQPPGDRAMKESRALSQAQINLQPRSHDEYAAVRVMEAELTELSERLRQTRLQLEEERQKRHDLRDDLEESRRLLDEERNKHRDTTKQLVILEEDKMTHQIQVSRLREQIEQNISLKESLQLDLDRTRMQLYHAKEKYETALTSQMAENEALRKKNDLLQLELQQSQSGGANKRDIIELEAQNAVLRQVVDRYRRALPVSRFNDSADSASKAAIDTPQLLSQGDFINSLMEALDKTKFLNKQMVAGSESTNDWSKQSWQDLCVAWREAVCELCDLFATAHRLESINLPRKALIP